MRHRIFSTLMALLVVVATYRVYDRQSRLIEVWQDRGETIDIYGPQMERKGFIKKERDQWSRYDSEWNKESTIQRADGGPIIIDEETK